MNRSLLTPPTRRELVLILAFILVLVLLLQPSVTTHLSEYRAYLPLPIGGTSSTRIPPQKTTEDGFEDDPKTLPTQEGELEGIESEADEEEPQGEGEPGGNLHWDGTGSEDTKPDDDVLLLPEFSPHREPYMADVRERWGEGLPSETKVVSHSAGFTVFENLYVLNGTVYIVTSNPSAIPERRLMSGSGAGIYNSPEEIAAQEPTDKDMQVITVDQAKQLFGDSAVRLHGTSFWTNDPAQLIAHYYHFSAELLFGIWRTYASLDPSITPVGATRLPAPRRWLFPHLPTEKWRDYASMNQYIMWATFPSVALFFERDCADLAKTGHVYLLERVVYEDRSAALRGPQFFPTQRIAALAFEHPNSRNWWAPVRSNVVRFAGGDVNPFLHPHHSQPPIPGIAPDTYDPIFEEKPVITYVSRQNWGRRMLKPEDHDRFVRALEDLRVKYDYEVNVVDMDKLSRDDQIKLAGRTTILCGVHGNGLTSLLWMKPTARSTVMEFFIPEGWAYDYEWTSRALGIVHYGWWNDTFITYPKVPQRNNYPDGFQGNEIPLDGEAVAREMHKRLSGDEEADD